MDAAIAKASYLLASTRVHCQIARIVAVFDALAHSTCVDVHHVHCRRMKRQHTTLGLVIIASLLFVAHQYIQFVAHIRMPFLNSYLDPALMMPILLHLQVLERRLILRDATIQLPETHIFGYFILAVLFGELVFPYYSERFTSDYWDIVSYSFGSLVYGIAQRMSYSN